jgi:hypothetical protein
MAIKMLNEANLLERFWIEAVNTIVDILNRGKIRINNKKIPNELWKGIPTTIEYFKFLRRKSYIKRNEVELVKFDPMVDEYIFLGYSSRRNAYL